MDIKLLQSKLFSSLVKPFLSQGWNSSRHPLSYLLMGTAAIATLGTAAAVQAEMGVESEVVQGQIAQVAQTAAMPASGRHLFGQVAQPDQIGQGYVVLERTGDRVYGALYYPSSSFDCFYGQVEGSDLAMTIVNSYDQEAYPYSLALAEESAVASSDATGNLAPFGLNGYFAIDTISDNDHRMLDTCRAVLPPQR
ncbi:hypothetical protein [Leptolyngbya sp. KIOST-1]|uniref:hypothetical protein n=1 Tax=Leptolyngbya sp. KIOST-1 TaxID=1229172 RepID=UPI00068DE69A|nr:hypothetical protein [Leptolyngbya sp. KIOST-1]